MSNTRPDPCTKLRRVGRYLYTPLRRHLSFTLTELPDGAGRSGTTICGVRGALDQAAALHRARRHNLLANIKLHELEPCHRCHDYQRPRPPR